MFWDKRKYKTDGFSIIELLIIIILIGILVAIIIPRIATRTELARQKTAMADLEMISSAQERAVVDTGYIYRLYALDDVAGDGDGIGFGGTNDVIDALKDEYNSLLGIYNLAFNNPRRLFIDPETGLFISDNQASNLFTLLHANETAFNWHGPYLVLQKDTGTSPWTYTSAQLPADGKDDIPDDPWGNNYLLFTKRGMVLENDGVITETVIFPSDGNTYNCKLFDRTTVLSLGKDGRPGDGSGPSSDPSAPGNFGQGDDIIRQF